jgi:hypothetical protein
MLAHTPPLPSLWLSPYAPAFFYGALPQTPPKGAALWNPAKGLSPLEPATDWNDAADEESAPFCRAKKGLPNILLKNNHELSKIKTRTILASFSDERWNRYL